MEIYFLLVATTIQVCQNIKRFFSFASKWGKTRSTCQQQKFMSFVKSALDSILPCSWRAIVESLKNSFFEVRNEIQKLLSSIGNEKIR
jgi:hypothetical protein